LTKNFVASVSMIMSKKVIVMVAKMVTLATIASVIGAMKGIMQISHMNVQTVQEVQNWLKSNVKRGHAILKVQVRLDPIRSVYVSSLR